LVLAGLEVQVTAIFKRSWIPYCLATALHCHLGLRFGTNVVERVFIGIVRFALLGLLELLDFLIDIELVPSLVVIRHVVDVTLKSFELLVVGGRWIIPVLVVVLCILFFRFRFILLLLLAEKLLRILLLFPLVEVAEILTDVLGIVLDLLLKGKAHTTVMKFKPEQYSTKPKPIS